MNVRVNDVVAYRREHAELALCIGIALATTLSCASRNWTAAPGNAAVTRSPSRCGPGRAGDTVTVPMTRVCGGLPWTQAELIKDSAPTANAYARMPLNIRAPVLLEVPNSDVRAARAGSPGQSPGVKRKHRRGRKALVGTPACQVNAFLTFALLSWNRARDLRRRGEQAE